MDVNPNLHIIISTNNDNNLHNIAYYWITKFDIRRELMISCNISLYMYQNKEAVCAPLFGGEYGGGGYGGVVQLHLELIQIVMEIEIQI